MIKWYIITKAIQIIGLISLVIALIFYFKGVVNTLIKIAFIVGLFGGLCGTVAVEAVKEKILQEELEKEKDEM